MNKRQSGATGANQWLAIGAKASTFDKGGAKRYD